MSARLCLAAADDLDRLLPLVEAFHALEGITLSDDARRAGLVPLLEGSPYGAVWLVGPRNAPLGYIVVTFGWSIEFGGLDAFLDEIYLRDRIRGRGIGTEALVALIKDLAGNGLRALHLEVAKDNAKAEAFYAKLGFKSRSRYNLMTWTADPN